MKKNLIKKEVISSNALGVIFGHKIEDMKASIQKFEEEGLDIVVITWPKYWLDFDGYEVHTQKTPINQGTDCIKLVKKSAELLFKVLEGRTIGKIANNHTVPTIWEWNLPNDEWKDLFDYNDEVRVNADELIQDRRKLFSPTKEEVGTDIGFEY